VDFYILVSLDVVDYVSCMDLVLVDRKHIAVSLFTFFPGKNRRKKFVMNTVGIDFISVPLCLDASRSFSCNPGHKQLSDAGIVHIMCNVRLYSFGFVSFTFRLLQWLSLSAVSCRENMICFFCVQCTNQGPASFDICGVEEVAHAIGDRKESTYL
jgi:hypothetical protein